MVFPSSYERGTPVQVVSGLAQVLDYGLWIYRLSAPPPALASRLSPSLPPCPPLSPSPSLPPSLSLSLSLSLSIAFASRPLPRATPRRPLGMGLRKGPRWKTLSHERGTPISIASPHTGARRVRSYDPQVARSLLHSYLGLDAGAYYLLGFSTPPLATDPATIL